MPVQDDDDDIGASTPEVADAEADAEAGLDLILAGVDAHVDGVEASMRERAEAGLQDTLDLKDWKMPSVRDYFWYLVVYTSLIALAIMVIYRYRMVWAYVLWGGYLVTLLVLAALIVRSLNYRRGTYSKAFSMSTLELQQAVEDAVEDVGLRVDHMEQPEGPFLRPMIAVYYLQGRGFTINVEGKSHLKRKVVRVGRFRERDDRIMGERLLASLDDHAENASRQRLSRSLFREEGAY